MVYRRMGRSGLKLSVFSIGSWVTYGHTVDVASARACLLAAYDGGVNFFDNAEAYGGGKAEEVVGATLKELRRESLVISSKVFWGGDGPNDSGLCHKHVVEACHAALRRLQTDYIDLYYCHRPDPHTPVEETVRAMDLLIRQGKVFYWGTSEWSAQQIREACAVAKQLGAPLPAVEQPQYHLFCRHKVEVEFADLYSNFGLGTTTWSPLASGILTGKYNEGIPDGSRLADERYTWLQQGVTKARVQAVRNLEPIARELGVSLAQLALAWCARNPHVSSVITGASRPDQVRENLKALGVIGRIDDSVNHRILAAVSQAQDRPGSSDG
jgi:voltage-dependent potassium channel beta subunit